MTPIEPLPIHPDMFYRKQWKGWGDFLNSANPYEWKTVEILKFNYNGMGDAIADCDGETTFLHQADLDIMMFEEVQGKNHYKTELINGRFVLTKP